MTETIETERLELVWLSPQLVEAILDGRHDELGFTVPDGWPDTHDRRFLAYRLRQMGSDEALGRWLVRGIVLPETGVCNGPAAPAETAARSSACCGGGSPHEGLVQIDTVA